MPRLQRKNFDTPDTVREFPRWRQESISLDETVIGHIRYEPGWRWSHDVRPIVGTAWCQVRHVGICVEGLFRVQLEDGTTMDIRPGDAFEIPPGHDAWVVGDTACVGYEWAGTRVYARAPEEDADGILATLLFTDIVGSTTMLERIGDKAWSELLLAHNAMIREQLDRHRGRELDTTGDGFLAMFDSASRAVRCGLKITQAAQRIGLAIRIGCHTGEIALVAGSARGVAVHTAARVMATADAGNVFVSKTTRDLLAAADFAVELVGTFEFKGLTGPREIFRVAMSQPGD